MKAYSVTRGSPSTPAEPSEVGRLQKSCLLERNVGPKVSLKTPSSTPGGVTSLVSNDYAYETPYSVSRDIAYYSATDGLNTRDELSAFSLVF